MKLRILLPLCVVCAISLLACTRTDESVNRNASAPATTSSPASTPATAVVVNNDKIGVPECDDFITAYDACVTGKVPEVARAQYKTAVEQWRSGWKQLANNPQTRGSLVAACKQAAEQQRVAMKSYNCTF